MLSDSDEREWLWSSSAEERRMAFDAARANNEVREAAAREREREERVAWPLRLWWALLWKLGR